MKDIWVILRRNFVSPIVISIFTLSLILLILGDVQDGLFLTVVISINVLIAVIQEIRAARALRKLELITAPYAHKIQDDGTTVDIRFNELRVGDQVALRLGDEVPADGEVISGDGLEVNESILTGESRAIDKPKGSKVCGASAVIAGTGILKIEAVGKNSQAGMMTLRLKRYDPRLTPIQSAIAKTITILTYGALFLGALIFIVYSSNGQDAVSIFKTIAAAAGGVVPEGLLLASSLLLAYGSIRLASVNVLPQKLSAIEGLALLDVVCMDKTGTITSDEINFENFEVFDNSVKEINQLIGIVAKDTSSTSTTGQAIIRAFPVKEKYETLQTLAFSSIKKFSGIKVKINNKTHSILMGAHEFLGKLSDLSKKQSEMIDELTRQGKRVLLVAIVKDASQSLTKLGKDSCKSIGVIVLTNEFRSGAEKSVKYLQDRGVKLCVISGDNPNTVQFIAQKVGVADSDWVITGEQLESMDQKSLDKKLLKTGVFARVLPDQKERLINTFERLGKYTGMVGDGVNDALALKKSDLGVAMYQGAPATRRIADLVLLDNSFNSLPLGMRLGNQIIQAVELIAILFFHKIIFGVVLLMITLILGVVYPFEPRHMTFMNIFLVTLPTIMWTLFPPAPRQRLSPRAFWKDTLLSIAPIAVLSGIVVALSYAILLKAYPNDIDGAVTITVIIATFFGVYMVYLVPRMFDVKNNRKARIARLVYSIAVLLAIIPSFTIKIILEFFNFTFPTGFNNWPLLIIVITVALLQWILANNAGKRLRDRTVSMEI